MTVPAKSVRATGNHQANIIVAYSSKIVSMLPTTCFVLVYAECGGNAIHDISLIVGRMFPYNSAMFIFVESNWGLISVEVRILWANIIPPKSSADNVEQIGQIRFLTKSILLLQKPSRKLV